MTLFVERQKHTNECSLMYSFAEEASTTITQEIVTITTTTTLIRSIFLYKGN